MVDELGIQPDDGDDNGPLKQGIMMFASFITFGAVPLLAYIPNEAPWAAFMISCFLTMLCLAVLGMCMQRLIDHVGMGTTRYIHVTFFDTLVWQNVERLGFGGGSIPRQYKPQTAIFVACSSALFVSMYMPVSQTPFPWLLISCLC